MTQDVIAFARNLSCQFAPCYHLVSRWLHACGVENIPSDSAARRWWFEAGPEAGFAHAAAIMRLNERAPHHGDVAVIDQGLRTEPILGLVADKGRVVVRAFGTLQVRRAHIIRCWGVDWAA